MAYSLISILAARIAPIIVYVLAFLAVHQCMIDSKSRLGKTIWGILLTIGTVEGAILLYIWEYFL